MNCSSADLKAYALAEMPEDERVETREHLGGCGNCRAELERLRLTQAALLSVRDEDIPRRIAFVSDKVFEPGWWQRLLQSGPRLGFASAAMLSLAILAHPFLTPPPATIPAPAAVDTARMEADISARISTVVVQAMAESEARQGKQARELVTAAEKRLDLERRGDMLAVQQSFEVLGKRMSVMLTASAGLGGAR